jgi:hypothetical protein
MSKNISYAASRNARFSNEASQFVNLVTRLENSINNLNKRARLNWESNLKKAIKAFKKSYPQVKSFKDRSKLRLVMATDIRLMEIFIDVTMQREPNLAWILTIIENFRDYQAQPIQVFKTPDGAWGAWDSQHTALALYLIATEALGLDPEDVLVPGNIYDITNRADLRNLFINMNTTTGKNAGKKPLDIIDIFDQMVWGVQVDGVNDPIWVDAHTKWEYIKAADLFVTADKFNDTDEKGAISRLNEINDASPEVVRQFCVYAKYIVELQERAIDSKESPIIIEFLNLCEQNQIKLTDSEIEDLAQHCVDLFDANFNSKGPFWQACHTATVNAWTRNNTVNKIPKHAWGPAPANNKNTPVGTSYFWHQLNKTWAPNQRKGFKFPKQPMNIYIPADADLM